MSRYWIKKYQLCSDPRLKRLWIYIFRLLLTGILKKLFSWTENLNGLSEYWSSISLSRIKHLPRFLDSVNHQSMFDNNLFFYLSFTNKLEPKITKRLFFQQKKGFYVIYIPWIKHDYIFIYKTSMLWTLFILLLPLYYCHFWQLREYELCIFYNIVIHNCFHYNIKFLTINP